MQPLVTTWPNVERHILRPLQTAPISPATSPSAFCCDIGLEGYREHVAERQSPPNVDSTLNTLRYMFFHMRCGILVSIRAGSLFMFAPFANAHYTNTWSDRVRFEAGSADEYAVRKSRITRKPREDWLPLPSWWMNGGIVCNVMPADVWGNAHCDALVDMITATCAAHFIPDCDFFINKRDYPQLRKDRGEPYQRFVGSATLARERYTHHAAVFSFYTGSDYSDVAMPLTEDWKLVSGEVEKPTDIALWEKTATTACFRGSATGNGVTPETNVRIRLVLHSIAHPDIVDAKFGSYNLRDKVVAATGDCITVGCLDAAALRLPPLAPWLSLAEQVQRFRYLLYADGHCAANRYGALMKTRRVILRVASERETDGGCLWLFPDLVGGTVGVDGAAVNLENADHFIIRPDLQNLNQTVHYLREHDDIAQAVAARALARSPTRDKILAAWQIAMTAAAVPKPSGTTPETGKIWFSPYDSRYAQIGRLDDSVRLVSLPPCA
jgi:hypothetical protein